MPSAVFAFTFTLFSSIPNIEAIFFFIIVLNRPNFGLSNITVLAENFKKIIASTFLTLDVPRPSFDFIQAFCKIGLVPDSGNSFFLPQLVGMARAKELCMLGDKLSAQTAQEYGLISKVYSAEQIDEEVQKLAIHFSTAPTYGLSLIKKALNESVENSLEEQLELEKNLQRAAGHSNDYKEGVSAFLNKRTPDFKGN